MFSVLGFCWLRGQQYKIQDSDKNSTIEDRNLIELGGFYKKDEKGNIYYKDNVIETAYSESFEGLGFEVLAIIMP